MTFQKKKEELISLEVKNLAGKAKEKKLQPSDWEGNTFTISNLGMFGIEEFTAIINSNDSCILAVGGIKEAPIVKNGELVPGNIMKVTMSCDHRIVDGATGAQGAESDTGLTYNPSTGTLAATNLEGTVQTAAQGSITSLGTLTGLTVNGPVVFNENSADVDFRVE